MTNFKKLRNIFLSLAIFGVVIFNSETFAFDYNFKGSALNIDSSSKTKVDVFFSKRVKNIELANRYIKALNKYNYASLSLKSQKVVDYLLYKIEVYLGNYEVSALSQTNNLSPTNLLPTSQQDFVSKLKSNLKDYVEVDNNYEFSKDGFNYLLKLTEDEYYIVDFNKPINAYLNLVSINNEILFKKGDKYYISKGLYYFEKKISISELKTKVKLFKQDPEPIVAEIKDGYYYADILSKYSYFQIPQDGFYLSQFPKISDLSSAILLNKNGIYQLVPSYSQKKLFPVSFLDGVLDKEKILKYLGTDIYNYTGDDIETMMNDIKNIAIHLTNGNNTDDEKIKRIYSWITGSISYDPFSLEYIEGKITKDYFEANVNTNVFSGIGAYKNKIAVCDGYSHLLFYMLSFVGVKDVIIETGDANTGNNVWIPHAWNKIGDFYYDSTWDINSGGIPVLFKWYKKTSDEFFTVRRKN